METVPSAPTTVGITVALMYNSFLVLWLGPTICLQFHFLSFSLCNLLELQNPPDDELLSFSLLYDLNLQIISAIFFMET